MAETASTIEIKHWVKRGSMLVNTSALDFYDPDHPYNQAKAQGVRPESFGIEHPLRARFKGKSRAELIDIIVELEALVRDMSRWA